MNNLKRRIQEILDAYPKVLPIEKRLVLMQLKKELLHDYTCVDGNCREPASHLVWYKRAGAMYTYVCLTHLAARITSQPDENPIVSVRAIEDAL